MPPVRHRAARVRLGRLLEADDRLFVVESVGQAESPDRTRAGPRPTTWSRHAGRLPRRSTGACRSRSRVRGSRRGGGARRGRACACEGSSCRGSRGTGAVRAPSGRPWQVSGRPGVGGTRVPPQGLGAKRAEEPTGKIGNPDGGEGSDRAHPGTSAGTFLASSADRLARRGTGRVTGVMSTRDTFEEEELLAHVSWVRALALQVARDPHVAGRSRAGDVPGRAGGDRGAPALRQGLVGGRPAEPGALAVARRGASSLPVESPRSRGRSVSPPPSRPSNAPRPTTSSSGGCWSSTSPTARRSSCGSSRRRARRRWRSAWG